MRFVVVAAGSLATLALISCGASDDGGGGGGTGGAGGQAVTPPPSWDRQVTPPADADAAAQRLACGYHAGALPAETQGASHPNGKDIPIDHILILMQENRSFDHYFQMLPQNGQPDVEVAPPTYTNPDKDGNPIAPYHSTTYCFVDTDHSWNATHKEYDDGKMDGFFLENDGASPPPHPLPDSTSGIRALGYYDQTDIPFYFWLANEYSIADHYHSALLGPTSPNRQFLYAGSSRGMIVNTLPSFVDQKGACKTDADCGGTAGSCWATDHACVANMDIGCGCKSECKVDDDCGTDAPVGTCNLADGGICKPIGRTVFDYMEQRQIDWKVYASGTPGFGLTIDAFLKYQSAHLKTIDDYYADAAAGTLPAVAFVDPHLANENYAQDDEHPPATPFAGQLFVAKVVDALQKSPEWSSSALFFTYDEHGGLFDHVPPPNACPPGDMPANVQPGDQPGDFDRYGVRVPMMVVSPFAKKHFVAHHVYDHTSILRFIEARFVLPAITNRDANAEVPWEIFDFANPPHLTPPPVTLPDIQQSKIDACAAVFVP